MPLTFASALAGQFVETSICACWTICWNLYLRLLDNLLEPLSALAGPFVETSICACWTVCWNLYLRLLDRLLKPLSAPAGPFVGTSICASWTVLFNNSIDGELWRRERVGGSPL